MATKIMECTCQHEYQDKTYGKQKRVMNKCKEKSKADKPAWRCTVCGRLHED